MEVRRAIAKRSGTNEMLAKLMIIKLTHILVVRCRRNRLRLETACRLERHASRLLCVPCRWREVSIVNEACLSSRTTLWRSISRMLRRKIALWKLLSCLW